ncbi:MAG: restriction endonuclease subunit S [Theionarchaea archaeon]|nr:restriction endonuclease subunit S [Theionarchaea archaeon]
MNEIWNINHKNQLEGWKLKRLEEVIDLKYGESLPENNRIRGEVPVYGSNGIVGYHNQALVKGPGIIVGRKGTVGAVNWSNKDFFPIDTTYYIELKNSEINLKWVYYLVSSVKLDRLNAATGVPGLNRGDAASLLVLFPPKKEQQEIASILQSIDNTIIKAKELIEKYKMIKQGLMHDLFARGVDENGNPHTEFKNSELGIVPKVWKVKKMISSSADKVNAVQTGPFGAQLHSYDYVDTGVPLILIKNIIDGKIVDYDIPYITEKKANSLSRYRLKEGDIVFSRVADVGRAAVAEKKHEGWLISGQMLRVRLNNSSVSNLFMKYFIESKTFQDTLRKRLLGSTRDSINTTILENMPIAIPSREEQSWIASTLLAVDKKIQSEQNYSRKLTKIKTGLMQDLLTGKVRVKVE